MPDSVRPGVSSTTGVAQTSFVPESRPKHSTVVPSMIVSRAKLEMGVGVDRKFVLPDSI